MSSGWFTIRPDTGWLMPLANKAKKNKQKNETYAGFEWTRRRLSLNYSDVVRAVLARVNWMRPVWEEVQQQMDERRGGGGRGAGSDIPPGHGGVGVLHC